MLAMNSDFLIVALRFVLPLASNGSGYANMYYAVMVEASSLNPCGDRKLNSPRRSLGT
jgi:hypothetical protein